MVVAVLDDGIQLDHPDLRANISSHPGESLNGFDDDANGYVDDLRGWDFYRDDNDPNPEFPADNHGTAAAGVVAAAANDDTGAAGIARGCRILPVKVIGDSQFTSDQGLADALYYAAGRARDGLGSWRGADVICIGFNFPQSAAVDSALRWAITSGRGGKGCLVFAAAGDQASRWQPVRVRLPVGARYGAGTYRFGFEYSKDVSSSAGEDLARIDNVALLAGDGVTPIDSPLGPQGRQDFEGAFPPAGWKLIASWGAACWSATTTGALTGTRGSSSAQSAAIGNNQWTELRTPPVTLTGGEVLAFACYISSEFDYDGLKIWVYDAQDNYVGVFAGPLEEPFISGNLALAPSVRYPASHPDVIGIGAATDCDVRGDSSAYGPGLDFLAPSSGGWNDVLTSDRTGAAGYTDGDYTWDFGGTSAACALAAGIGALVLSVNPELTASEVRTVLRLSCEQIGNVIYDGNGWNAYYGHGRLNAEQAVTEAQKTIRVNLRLAMAVSQALVNDTNQLTYVLSVSNSGPATARGVMLTNLLPLSACLISASPDPAFWLTPSVPVFDLGSLPAGGVLNVTMLASATTTMTGAITNLAMVGSAMLETDLTDNQASAVTTVLPPRVQIVAPTNNVVLLAPANFTITALTTDPERTIRKLEFYAGATKIGVDTNAPYTITWANPKPGDYTLTANAIDTHGASNRSAAITVAVMPGISVGDATAAEGHRGMTNALFPVRLSAASSRTITVNYSTLDGTAVAGRDYLATAGTLVFPPGTTNKMVRVAVVGNTFSESNKTFWVNLSAPVDAGLADAQGRGVILNDDPLPALSIGGTSVTEGPDGAITYALFAVGLSAPSGRTVTVQYATANGTAVGGVDFVPANGLLTFPPGITNQTVAITVLGDTLGESNETFWVTLIKPTNATIAVAKGRGVILNDDPGPVIAISDASVTEGHSGTTNAVFAVRLSAPSARPVTVKYATAPGTAIAGQDFRGTNGTLTFLPGITNKVIRVTVLGDRLRETDETFWVVLSKQTNATIGVGVGRGLILSDDPLP